MAADNVKPDPAGQGADDGAQTAEDIVAQVETGPRHPDHWFPRALIVAICVAWSVFQILHANEEFVTRIARYIHLSFAFALVFLAYPAFKTSPGKPEKAVRNNGFYALFLAIVAFALIDRIGGIVSQFLDDEGFAGYLWAAGVIVVAVVIVAEAVRRAIAFFFLVSRRTEFGERERKIAGPHDIRTLRQRIPPYDYALALLGIMTTLYLIYDFDEITMLGGLMPEDAAQMFAFSILILFLLLEAARRALGLPLAVLAGLFLMYSMWPQLEAGEVFGIGPLDWFFATFLPPLPEFLNPPPQPFQFIVGEMYLTDTSIFGVPIDVSVTYVFLFVLFGALLDRAGAGRYFIDVAFAGLGSQRAGPAKAAIVGSGATGLVSGSSIANTVTTGTFTIPLMKEVGLPAHKAGAVEVAASTNGQLMPPIMGAAAFIMAELVPHVDYLDVVRAAIIPALISYLALFYVVHLEALKLGIRRIPKSELPPFLKTFLRGLHYLVPLFVLIYFLIVERKTPATSALYAMEALAVLMLLQRPIIAYLGLGAQKKAGNLDTGIRLVPFIGRAFLDGLKDIWDGLVSGARNMIAVGIATAAAGIIVGVITITGLVGRFVTVIETLSFGNIYLALVLTALTSMILGMGLPTTVNYILMASLTAPVVLHIGAEQGLLVPIIAAHLFVFYFGILADDTPPVGLAAYAAAAIARADPIKTGIQGFTYDMRTAILPFVFFFNTELLMISGAEENGAPIWIDDPFIIGFVFVIALAAMFAFAAMLQGYFADRCAWWERVVLALACLIMFLPSIVASEIDISRRVVQIAGLAIVAGMYAMQKVRVRRRDGYDT